MIGNNCITRQTDEAIESNQFLSAEYDKFSTAWKVYVTRLGYSFAR